MARRARILPRLQVCSGLAIAVLVIATTSTGVRAQDVPHEGSKPESGGEGTDETVPAPLESPPNEEASGPEGDVVDEPADSPAPTPAEAPSGPPAVDPVTAPEPATSTTTAAPSDVAAPATDRVAVFIMDLLPIEGASDDTARALTGLIAARLDGMRVFDVRSEDDVRQLVDFDQLRTVLTEADDASRLAEIGKTLGVQYLVTGSAVGADTRRVDLVVYDLATQTALRREVVEAETRGALARELTRGVDALARPILAKHSAQLFARVSEDGATLRVDGDAVGVSPQGVRKIGAGPHTLVASKEGFVSAEVDVWLQPGKTTTVDLVLVPSPEFVAAYRTQAWLWYGAAGALAFAGAASLVGAGGFAALDWYRSGAIAAETGQVGSSILRLRSAHYTELVVWRFGAAFFAVAALPAFAAAALTYFWAPPLDRYDHLVEEGGEG